MKSSNDLRGDSEHLFIAEDMSRRQFLKAGVGLAAVASGLEMIGGCATTETPTIITLVYPPLPDKKIQPPQEGCLVGFFKESAFREKDSRFIPKRSSEIEAARRANNFDEFVEILKKENFFEKRKRYQTGNEINYLEKALSAKPFLFVLLGPRLYSGFPVTQAIEVAKRGIVPFIRASLGPYELPTGIPGLGPKEIVQGQHDGYIKPFAQGAAEFGKEYGGFFFSTMEEMNGTWYSWGANSNFIPAWRHIWEIFEDQGANQYATWIWLVYCPEGVPGSADNPESYYPGDKYVDWIGLHAYSIAGKPKTDYMLNVLIRETYRRLFKDHPQKPIMISSFGRTNENNQSRWLINAYSSIRKSFPAIKAVICFDNTMRLTGDHTLNPKSLETLREVFKDPYWVMAK